MSLARPWLPSPVFDPRGSSPAGPGPSRRKGLSGSPNASASCGGSGASRAPRLVPAAGLAQACPCIRSLPMSQGGARPGTCAGPAWLAQSARVGHFDAHGTTGGATWPAAPPPARSAALHSWAPQPFGLPGTAAVCGPPVPQGFAGPGTRRSFVSRGLGCGKGPSLRPGHLLHPTASRAAPGGPGRRKSRSLKSVGRE